MISKTRIKESLYEYEIMTPIQLSNILNYAPKTIYTHLSRLFQSGEVNKIQMPQIKRGSKAYFLAPTSAKQIAEMRNELYLFREKEWERGAEGALNTLVANQFFSEIIRSTRHQEGIGLSDWVGSRSLKLELDQKQIPKMHGYGIFHAEDQQRDIFLNVLTGHESFRVLQNMVTSHYEYLVSQFPSESSRIILLFLCLSAKSMRVILRLWDNLSSHASKMPFVAAAHFGSIAMQGIFSPSWRTLDGQNITLLELPFKKGEKIADQELMGKQEPRKLEYQDMGGLIFHME